MAEFEHSLKGGHKIEELVLDHIKPKYPKAYRVEGYCKDGDIYIPEIDKYVEVKSDKKSHYTGNIVVEIEFNGEPSALSTTKSWYWVFADGEYLAWLFPDLIWKCIIRNHLEPVTFIGKGDTKPKKAYLVPRRLLYSYSDKLIKYEYNKDNHN